MPLNRIWELTDVIAYSDYVTFLIEIKALCILGTAANRTMERKVLTLQNQIGKAISQLVGAAKKITEKVAVFDAKGKEIDTPKTSRCIASCSCVCIN